MRSRHRWFMAAGGACAVVIAVAFALAYSWAVGSGNQNTYLLDPLVRAFPELYRQDWFVADNHHYHIGFAAVTAPLYALDPDGGVAFGIAQLIVAAATYASIFALCAAITSRARLTLFAGLIGLLVVGGDRALGGGYLFGGYLQPSSLTTLAWLLAMNAWIRDRMLFAGLALGVGAVFHLNYALLGIGVFGLCELTAHRNLRRMALLLVPSLFVVIVFLPSMIAASHANDDKLALFVLVDFVFPGHFKPRWLRLELPSLLGWFVIALVLRPVDRSPASERLFRFAMVVMAVCIAAVLVVSIPPLLPLTRVFVWRIAPFGVLAAQLLLFVEVRKIARGDRARPRGWQLAALAFAAAVIAYNAFVRRRAASYAEVVTCVMIAYGLCIWLRREQIATAVCTVTCVIALWWGRHRLVSPELFTAVNEPLTAWARTSSPQDAVFLVPPYYSQFRLHARRAIVVDLKSPPMYLDELVTWYQRLCAVADVPAARSVPALVARWDALPADRLIAIAQKFHASYVVLAKGRNTARLTLPIAYEDGESLVYALP